MSSCHDPQARATFRRAAGAAVFLLPRSGFPAICYSEELCRSTRRACSHSNGYPLLSAPQSLLISANDRWPRSCAIHPQSRFFDHQIFDIKLFTLRFILVPVAHVPEHAREKLKIAKHKSVRPGVRSLDRVTSALRSPNFPGRVYHLEQPHLQSSFLFRFDSFYY